MNSDFGLNEKTVAAIRSVFSRYPEIQQAVLFGSRAKGTYKPGSDIDLALKGQNLTQKTLNRLYVEMDDLPIPHELSLVLWDNVTDREVAAHIARVGIVFYEGAGAGQSLTSNS